MQYKIYFVRYRQDTVCSRSSICQYSMKIKEIFVLKNIILVSQPWKEKGNAKSNQCRLISKPSKICLCVHAGNFFESMCIHVGDQWSPWRVAFGVFWNFPIFWCLVAILRSKFYQNLKFHKVIGEIFLVRYRKGLRPKMGSPGVFQGAYQNFSQNSHYKCPKQTCKF